ncbi:hypothetical protein FJMB80379_14070 [Enterobacter hormaechei]|nr:hypothetical protein FJMB80379_14070 [Enterobacter hormaechei]
MRKKAITPHALYNAARKPAPALEVRGISPKVFFHFLYTGMALNRSPSSAKTGFNRAYHRPM